MRSDLMTVNGRSPDFWRVYNRLAKLQYETEHCIEPEKRWYTNGLMLLESMIHERTVSCPS